MNIAELQSLDNDDLLKLALEMGIAENGSAGKRHELMSKVLHSFSENDGSLKAGGILSVVADGYGFLRQNSGQPGSDDVYVSQSQIRRFGLRTGDEVSGQVRPPKDGERYFGLVRVEGVNGLDPDTSRTRPKFENLTAIFPTEHIILETDPKVLSTRLIDLLAPVGRGQRGLIVSPPKAGKTTLLKQIANGLAINAPDIHIMVALIGERPEEVTDMRRSITGEVFSSTFDEPVEDHCRVAEMVLERAKRLVESGSDVVILLDSITRLTRAYNLAVPSSGRTLSGGMDPVALYPPKHFFGAARNTEEGGSLTILAACLIDTGSRMDELIYEEFKGTGNMEVHLDRRLAERRTYPALDIDRSGTRREELLLEEATLKKVMLLRRMVGMITSNGMDHLQATEKVLEQMAKTKNNVEFLATLGRT
jgi:transcription termination factor Rho